MSKLIVLCLMWLAWSGHYTIHEPLIAAFGAASVLLVLLLSRRMASAHSSEGAPGLSSFRVLGYLPYLLWEIVKANIAVVKIVLSPDLPICRQIVRVPASQRSPAGRVLHANSITLTPGTISLGVHEDHILVHAIDDAAAQGVLEGEMNRRVSALEDGRR